MYKYTCTNNVDRFQYKYAESHIFRGIAFRIDTQIPDKSFKFRYTPVCFMEHTVLMISEVSCVLNAVRSCEHQLVTVGLSH